jgi:hypothetical protein
MAQSSARFALFALVFYAAGCGRAKEAAPPESPQPGTPPPSVDSERYASPPPAQAPAPPPAAESGPPTTMGAPEPKKSQSAPETLAEAEAALTQARAELDSAWAELGRGGASAPARAPAGRAADERETRASAGASKSESRCGNACRAFASLERAAGAVCRLAGDATERCARARKIREQSELRVTTCGCSRTER